MASEFLFTAILNVIRLTFNVIYTVYYITRTDNHHYQNYTSLLDSIVRVSKKYSSRQNRIRL